MAIKYAFASILVVNGSRGRALRQVPSSQEKNYIKN
jgi:hypothetical protein